MLDTAPWTGDNCIILADMHPCGAPGHLLSPGGHMRCIVPSCPGQQIKAGRCHACSKYLQRHGYDTPCEIIDARLERLALAEAS